MRGIDGIGMNKIIYLDEHRKTKPNHLKVIENKLIESLALCISENEDTQQESAFELMYELIKDITTDDLIEIFEKEVDEKKQSWILFKDFYELPKGLQNNIFWKVKAKVILNLTEPELDL